ncbi:metallophosphoesterase [Virgibacillus halodenitrificans]|nr:metallophosphoesterase [Virgibacillus halodenitrificans]
MLYIVILLVVILLCYYFYIGFKNTHDVVINQFELAKEAANNTDVSLQILHISDMHLENISITPQELYKELKGCPVDLIALTGDYLDRKRTIPKLIPYLEALNKLNPQYGSYAIFGNHDYVLKEPHFNRLKDLLNEYGFQTLQNENKIIDLDGQKINIIGIDDYSTNRSDIEKSYQGIEDGYRLVLTHDPNVVLDMAEYDFDYLLSGHFHGGQICWPKPYHLVKMGKLVRMNMIKGLHDYQGRPFYISEGLGQTGVNIRIGSRPEITYHRVFIQDPVLQKQIEDVKAG